MKKKKKPLIVEWVFDKSKNSRKRLLEIIEFLLRPKKDKKEKTKK